MVNAASFLELYKRIRNKQDRITSNNTDYMINYELWENFSELSSALYKISSSDSSAHIGLGTDQTQQDAYSFLMTCKELDEKFPD